MEKQQSGSIQVLPPQFLLNPLFANFMNFQNHQAALLTPPGVLGQNDQVNTSISNAMQTHLLKFIPSTTTTTTTDQGGVQLITTPMANPGNVPDSATSTSSKLINQALMSALSPAMTTSTPSPTTADRTLPENLSASTQRHVIPHKKRKIEPVFVNVEGDDSNSKISISDEESGAKTENETADAKTNASLNSSHSSSTSSLSHDGSVDTQQGSSSNQVARKRSYQKQALALSEEQMKNMTPEEIKKERNRVSLFFC